MAEGCGFHSLQNLRRFANMRLLKLDLILGKERQHTFPRPRPPRWASGTFLTILDFSSHPGTAFPGIFWQFFTFSKQPWALPRLTSPGHNELASPEIFWQFPSQGGKVVHPPPNQDKPRPHPLPFLLPPCDGSWIINLIYISFVVPSSSSNEDRSNLVENPIIAKCSPPPPNRQSP